MNKININIGRKLKNNEHKTGKKLLLQSII